MARNTIVINVDLKETRVALIEDGVIAELQIERAAHRSTVGNVVLGRVTRVLPGMQAAFIDVGQERAAFLHVEDLIRPKDFDAYLAGGAREDEKPKVSLAAAPEKTTAPEMAAAQKAAEPETVADGAADVSGVDDATPSPRSRRRRGRRGRGRGDERARAERDAVLAQAGGALVADEVEPEDEGASEELTTSEPQPVRAAASSDASLDDDTQEEEDFELDVDADDFRRDDSLFDESDIEFDDDARRSTPSVDTTDDDSDDDDSDDDDSDDDDSDDDDSDDDDSDDDDSDDDLSDDDLSDDDLSDDDLSDDDLSDDDDSDDDDSDDDDARSALAAYDQSRSDPLEPHPGNSATVTAAGTELTSSSNDIADETSEASLGAAFDPAPPVGTSVTVAGGRRSRRGAARKNQAALDRVPADGHGAADTGVINGNDGANGEPTKAPSDESDSTAPIDTATNGAAATSAPICVDREAGPRARRAGRKRRRRGGRGNSEAPPSDAADAGATSSSPELDTSEGNKRSRRRRGRRGRRANGDPEQRNKETAAVASGPRKIPARVSRSVPISEVVKEGDQVVVQISKEPIGTKGARVTSHISLPGRYVVYLPTVEHVGISKRIGNAKERARLRKSIDALKPQTGGLIVRTVAEGLTKKQLKSDVGYLIKVWSEVAKKREAAKPPDILYEELDLVLKAARDLFTDGVEQIVIDDRDQYGRLCRFVEMFMPGRVKDIRLYTGDEPIFDAYGIEDEIKRALSRKVPLPSGGSLIVDQAEALTAIDVNTGRYVGKGSKDLEETALKTNLEAVDEIAYQLRFRNIGGLVILDLIDMEKAENREKVWRTLEQKLAKDKAKTTINRISELGLIEMTRKRTRESLGRVMHEPCFYCDGTGHIQSRETIAYEILRQIRRDRMTLPGYSVRIHAHPAVTDFLKHEAIDALQEAERRYMRRIELVPHQEYHIEQYDLQGR